MRVTRMSFTMQFVTCAISLLLIQMQSQWSSSIQARMVSASSVGGDSVTTLHKRE